MRAYPLPFQILALTLLLVAFSSAGSRAQSLDKGGVEGVLFYKEYPFLDDTSVQLIEYRSSKTFDKITYLETSHGKSMRISNEQVAFVLCYPGRGQVGRNEALAISDLATARYPQFAPFIARVKAAWVRVTPEEAKKQANASEIRNGFLARVLAEINEASQFKGPTPPQSPNLLDDHRPNSGTATPPPVPALDAGAAPDTSPAPATSIPGVPAELQQTLEIIREPATP